MKRFILFLTFLAASTAIACPGNRCANNAELIGHIASYSDSYNDVVEDDIISELVTNRELSNLQLDAVLLIFKSAERSNGLDEDYAIKRVIATPDMTQDQLDVLRVLISNTSQKNDIIEADVIYELLNHDINTNLVPTLSSIIRSAERSNGVYENDTIIKLIRSCPQL